MYSQFGRVDFGLPIKFALDEWKMESYLTIFIAGSLEH